MSGTTGATGARGGLFGAGNAVEVGVESQIKFHSKCNLLC